MPEKIAFVSDLHLTDATEPNAQLFIRLLDRFLKEGFAQIFLVGDVFDLWIADHSYFARRFAAVVAKLQELKAAGIEIHYFEGNHDLDLRPFFESKLGIIVHETAFCTSAGGKRIRVEHGDQMDPEDRDYLFLRWLLRTKIVRWLGRHLPGKIVSWIGATASRGSRRYTTRVHSGLGEDAVRAKLLKHAERAYGESPFDILIAGHVHVAFDGNLANGARVVNLGTWLERPLTFEISHGGAHMLSVPSALAEESSTV